MEIAWPFCTVRKRISSKKNLDSFGNLIVESSVFVFMPAYRYFRPGVHVREHSTNISRGDFDRGKA